VRERGHKYNYWLDDCGNDNGQWTLAGICECISQFWNVDGNIHYTAASDMQTVLCRLFSTDNGARPAYRTMSNSSCQSGVLRPSSWSQILILLQWNIILNIMNDGTLQGWETHHKPEGLRFLCHVNPSLLGDCLCHGLWVLSAWTLDSLQRGRHSHTYVPCAKHEIPTFIIIIYLNSKWVSTLWQWYCNKTQHTNKTYHTNNKERITHNECNAKKSRTIPVRGRGGL
jgi:hypothetical protein